jgi:hypothetical protein
LNPRQNVTFQQKFWCPTYPARQPSGTAIKHEQLTGEEAIKSTDGEMYAQISF